MLEHLKDRNIYVYCELADELKLMKDKINQGYLNLFICKALLLDKFVIDRKVYDRSYLRKPDNTVVQWSANKNLEKLCE